MVRMSKKMKKNTHTHGVLIVLIALVGCAKPGPILDGVGALLLVKDGRAVEVEKGAELAISWVVDGQYYGCWARGRNGERAVMVRLVEANAGFVRVRAEAWKKVEDLPWSYLRAPGLKVAARSGQYERPTVSIPIEQIEEVQVFVTRRKPEGRAGLTRANLVAGALGGAGIGGIAVGADRHFAAEEDLNREDFWTDERAFRIVGLSTGVGAVAYPTYKALWPKARSELKETHRISEGWRIEVRR